MSGNAFPTGGTKSYLRRVGSWLVDGELTIVGQDGRSRTVRLGELVTNSNRPLSDDEALELTVPVGASAVQEPRSGPRASESVATEPLRRAARP